MASGVHEMISAKKSSKESAMSIVTVDGANDNTILHPLGLGRTIQGIHPQALE
jgi:hypothetical protein